MRHLLVILLFLLCTGAVVATEPAIPVEYYHCEQDSSPCTDIGANASDRITQDVRFTQETYPERSDSWDRLFIHFYPKHETAADELSMTDGCYRTQVTETDAFYRVRWEQYASPWHCTRAGMPYGVVDLFDSPLLFIRNLF